MKATEQIELKALNKTIDMFKDFDRKHGWIDYFIAPVLVVIILLVVYALKGVYPFGVNTVAYYDMPSTNIPGFAYIWDVIHGKSSMFFNWLIALGASNSSGIALVMIPFNYLFILTSRDGILYFTSILLMIYLVLCAFSMSFYYKKHFSGTVGSVCTGLLYAFCGYSIQYYNNLDFLNYAFLLPLLVYALEKTIREHKFVFFGILVFFLLIQNPQFAFMFLIYIVFKGYFILHSVSEDMKGKSLRLFAASMGLAVIISCCVTIPEILQLTNTTRVEAIGEGFNYVSVMKNVYNMFRRQKHFIMYGSEIAVGLFFLLLIQGKTMIKKYYENICMIIILGLPILHEGINVLWHAGSYKHFPMRFGFMLTFECFVFVGSYMNNESIIDIKYVGNIAKILGVAMIPFVGYVLYDFMGLFTIDGISDLNSYYTYWIYFITLSVEYLLIFMMNSEMARKVALVLLVLIQAFCGCYGFIAPQIANIDHYRIQYVVNSIDLGKEFKDETDYTERIKANPAEYESNYSYITCQPAISGWSYGMSSELEYELRDKMGYDGMSSYIMDTGGTVFTDALLGIKRIASSYNPDDDLYLIDNTKEKVYDCKFTLPFGLIFEIDSIKDSGDDSFGYQNALFESVTGITDELIFIAKADDFIEIKRELTDEEFNNVKDMYKKNALYGADEDLSEDISEETFDEMDQEGNSSDDDSTNFNGDLMNEFCLRIPVSGEKTLYLDVNNDFDGELSFVINGKPVYLESFITRGGNTYPNTVRNGILSLGTFKDENFELLVYTTNKNLKNVKIGFLDLDILYNGIEAVKKNQNLNVECDKSSMHVTGKANKSGRLFLPVGYSYNWHAKMNGKDMDIKPYLNDAFISVDVEEGDVDITFFYLPKGIILGIAVSIFGLILGVWLIVFVKHGGIKGKKCEPIFDRVFIYGFNTVVTVLFIIMYVIPIWIKMSL